MKNWSRLREIKRSAVETILPRSDHVAEAFWPTVYAFNFSYSMGRLIVEAAAAIGKEPQATRILIVGAWGGRDYHWLKGFGYQPEILDLGHHTWAPTNYIGDVSETETWAKVPGRYDLVILCDVLEHLPRDFDALRHVRAALEPEGHLLLSLPFGHDLEVTHVRAYTDTTLRRLLGLAGFEVGWAKRRQGLIEALPWATQSLNYGLALLCPGPKWGGRLIARLLSWEYSLNEHTRLLFWRFGRSPQKGMIYSCHPAKEVDGIVLQKRRHLPDGSVGEVLSC
jgi:hypothetical protein